MRTRVVFGGLLALGALATLASPAEAFGRKGRSASCSTPVYHGHCYDPCHVHYYDPCHVHYYDPCHDPCHHHHHHHHHHCYCLAYKDPYARTGAIFVRCDSPGGCSSGWHWCFVFRTGTYEWVKVYRCYPHGTPYDKEAEQAEGFQKAAAEMTGDALVTATVPAGAKVSINGTAMPASSDTTRQFQTPRVIPAGETVTYEFAVEYVKDGKTLTSRQQVTLRGGQGVNLRFDDAADASVAAR